MNGNIELHWLVQENLDIENYTALVDKGYHNGPQIQECSDAKITTIVASPALVNSNEKGTTKAYMNIPVKLDYPKRM